MPFVNEQQGDEADQADTGQQAAAGAGLTTGDLVEYVLTFLSSNVMYTGESRPLQWEISRADGIACDPPTSAVVTAASGTVGQVLLDPDPPAGSQIVGVEWLVGSVGYPLVTLAVTMADAETRIDEQVISVV